MTALNTLSHRFTEDRGFPASSRFLDGHFPGNPIVPGAVILGYLAARLAESGLSILRVNRMKFLRPLLPDTPMEVLLHQRGDAMRVDFRDADGVFATARLVLGSRE